MRSLVLVGLVAVGASACSDSSDANAPANSPSSPDATPMDAAPDVGFAPDPDTGIPGEDAGFADSAVDAGFPDGGEADAGDSGTGPEQCRAVPFNAVLFGRIDEDVVFLPGSANEWVETPLETGTADRQRSYVARMRFPNGVAWVAQMVSDAASIDVEVEQVAYDADTGAVFAYITTRSVGDRLRFFSADGTLAATFTRDGAAGQDLVGGRGQTNLFIARYDANGAVQWVRRFGPNDAATTRRAGATGLTLTGGQLRVAASINANPAGPAALVVAPGTINEVTRSTEREHGIMFELDAATGAYVAGSLKVIIGADRDLRTFVLDNGATNASGVHAFTGGSIGAADVVSYGGAAPVTTGAGSTVVARYGDDGAPSWVRLIRRAASNNGPRPWSITVPGDGSVIAALYANAASATDQIYELTTGGGNQTVTLDGRDNLLVRYAADGSLAWTYRIASRTERQLYRLVPFQGDLLALGQVGSGTVFDPTATSPIVLDGNGAWVARFVWASGALQWVQHIGASSVGPVFVDRPTVNGSFLEVPVRMQEATVTRGPDPIRVRMASGNPAFGIVRYRPNGTYEECYELVSAGDGLRVVVDD